MHTYLIWNNLVVLYKLGYQIQTRKVILQSLINLQQMAADYKKSLTRNRKQQQLILLLLFFKVTNYDAILLQSF